jgi:hypothetical protein
MNLEHGIPCAGQSALTLKLRGRDGVYSNVSCGRCVIRRHPFIFFGRSYVRGNLCCISKSMMKHRQKLD